MANRVIHFEIQADDPERAKEFYEMVFGWKIDKYEGKEASPSMEYWTIETGTGPGINGGMYKRPEGAPPPESIGERHYLYDCTIAIDDIDATIKAVEENGGKILRQKMEMKGLGWFSRITDTEGNRVGLMQPTDWQPK